MSNRKILTDEFMEKINGGRLYAHAYDFVESVINNVKANTNYTKEDLIEELIFCFQNGQYQNLSTNGSIEDLDKLIEFINNKW